MECTTFGFLRNYAVITPVKSYHIILAREAPLRPPIVFRFRHGYTVRQTNLRSMSTNSSYSTNNQAFHFEVAGLN